jgi:hypothetical protein
MKPSISHSNAKWAEQIKKLLPKTRREVAVGFPRGVQGLNVKVYPVAHQKSAPLQARAKGASVLDVAVWNNYGVPSRNIPARPFMQMSAVKMPRAVHELMRKITAKAKEKGVLLGPQGVERAYKAIGQLAVSIVRDTITTGSYVPNSPITIARKQSDKPLIDTGLLRKFVTFVVRATR